jgi:general secretion pathway protein C
MFQARRIRFVTTVALPLLVGLAAFFDAQGLSALAGMTVLRRVLPSEAVLGEAPRTSAPPLPCVDYAGAEPPTCGQPPSAEIVLARNIFDSVTGSLLRQARADEIAPVEPEDPLDVPRCTGVRAVVIASFADPEASLAAFEIEGGDAVLRREGGTIGEARVEAITAARVFLRAGGKLCQAALFAPVVLKERSPATPQTVPSGGAVDPSLAKGIEQIRPGAYRIDRSLVDKLLSDPSAAARGGMIRPDQDGMRVLGVRPDGLLGLLGMKAGDTIRAINGYELTSPERMLEAYARLQTATELRVDFLRDGRETTSTYAIQ